MTPTPGPLHRLGLNDPLVLGSVLLFALVMLCSAVVHLEEGWGWLDSVYFSVTSVTTLGDPNFAPAQDATKLFLIFYLPLGIGVGFAVLAALGARVLEMQRRRVESLRRAHREDTGDHNGAPGAGRPPSS